MPSVSSPQALALLLLTFLALQRLSLATKGTEALEEPLESIGKAAAAGSRQDGWRILSQTQNDGELSMNILSLSIFNESSWIEEVGNMTTNDTKNVTTTTSSNTTGEEDDDDQYYDDLWEDDDSFHGSRAETVQSILPKIAAILSTIGSTCIITEVYNEHQNTGRPKATNQILISMLISDVISSIAWFFGTWAAPSDTQYLWNPRGTTGTCSLQGFMIQLGWAATPLFNLALSWYVLLTVRYSWREPKLQALDPWLHGSIWGLTTVMAIIPLFFDLYNNSWSVCWIDKTPWKCKETYEYGYTTCDRGDNATIWGLVYTAFPGWLCMILSVAFMGMLYWTVRELESRGMRNTITASSTLSASNTSGAVKTTSIQLNTINRNKSTMVALQGILYVMVHLVVFLPDAIATIFIRQADKFWIQLDTFAYTMIPLQGLLNFFVFVRKREKMHSGYGQVMLKIICCCGITAEHVRMSLKRTEPLEVGEVEAHQQST